MIAMTLEVLAQVLKIPQHSAAVLGFRGVSIDSRQCCAGALFIALKGERFDGHHYVDAAYRVGAVVALVEAQQASDIPQLIVDDCQQAMMRLAEYWRRQCPARVIALTGSNGKTTIKDMLAHILGKQAPMQATQGNFNNDIGVPLTLFRLSPNDRYAVIELGASHAGDIARLAAVVNPDVVYVNNAAAAHLSGFGTLQAVRDAKGELYRYCQKHHRAVFNLDEVASQQWQKTCASVAQITCALTADADVRATWQSHPLGVTVQVHYAGQTQQISLAVLGEHNVRNALAAITIAMFSGIEFDVAVMALENFSGPDRRLQIRQGPKKSRLIDDSYNANPASLVAGVKVVCAFEGRAWLALGDMAELGEDAQELHQQAAEMALRQGVEKMFGLGPYSSNASQVFGENGYGFKEMTKMATTIRQQIQPDVSLLVKGSRSSGMDQFIEILLKPDQLGDAHHAL